MASCDSAKQLTRIESRYFSSFLATWNASRLRLIGLRPLPQHLVEIFRSSQNLAHDRINHSYLGPAERVARKLDKFVNSFAGWEWDLNDKRTHKRNEIAIPASCNTGSSRPWRAAKFWRSASPIFIPGNSPAWKGMGSSWVKFQRLAR